MFQMNLSYTPAQRVIASKTVLFKLVDLQADDWIQPICYVAPKHHPIETLVKRYMEWHISLIVKFLLAGHIDTIAAANNSDFLAGFKRACLLIEKSKNAQEEHTITAQMPDNGIKSDISNHAGAMPGVSESNVGSSLDKWMIDHLAPIHGLAKRDVDQIYAEHSSSAVPRPAKRVSILEDASKKLMELAANLEEESEKDNRYWVDRVTALEAQLDLQKEQNALLQAELAQCKATRIVADVDKVKKENM